jgi:hypothetical protein
VENMSRQQTNVAKGIQTNQNRKSDSSRPGYKSIWHWLIKHPVEFSKNKHTPRTIPQSCEMPDGASIVTRRHRQALLPRYPLAFTMSTRYQPDCHATYTIIPTTHAAANHHI